MTRARNNHNAFTDDFHYEQLAIPWAFINGLFLGGLLLRKGRQYLEKGPMDRLRR